MLLGYIPEFIIQKTIIMFEQTFKNIDDMPILALEEGINFNNPFVLIRIINDSSKIGIKVMYANIDINKVVVSKPKNFE